MKEQEHLTSRLLSGHNKMSGAEKEQILQNLLQPQRASKKSVSKWLTLSFAGSLTAIVAVVFVLRSQEHSFTSKGGEIQGANFSISCGERGPEQPCQQGEKLIFQLETGQGDWYFSALAQRQDQTVIWYFPGFAQSESVQVGANSLDGVLLKGVMLGQEHSPGTYQVFGIFSRKPLHKEQVRQILQERRQDSSVFVVTRELLVSAK